MFKPSIDLPDLTKEEEKQLKIKLQEEAASSAGARWQRKWARPLYEAKDEVRPF
jgi:hypothetical protein